METMIYEMTLTVDYPNLELHHQAEKQFSKSNIKRSKSKAHGSKLDHNICIQLCGVAT